jgi:hypothetical protein
MHNGEIYRQINEAGYPDYQFLMQSKLYQHLLAREWIVPHTEVSNDLALNEHGMIVIKPRHIPFISYSYEWSFSQLKDAALLTLEIVKHAMQYGMILKDASAYNIQFQNGSPIFIDTGSFEKYEEGTPWVAYHQFCKHFLAPLVLMAKKDFRLGAISKQYIDGIPLDLTSQLLPFKTRLSPSLFAHIHAHAKAQRKFSDSNATGSKITRKVSKNGLLGLVDNLSALIKKLTWNPIKSEWGDYYNQTNYSDVATQDKAKLVQRLVGLVEAKIVWDVGGNNGYYSRVVASENIDVVCFDIDPTAVETNYRKIKQDKSKSILPLILDLTNPSTSIGWAETEREGLLNRANADLVMALALIHHLALSNNIPFDRIARYFSFLSPFLMIEFVPKEDSQVQRLLVSRQDIFDQYNIECFRESFSKHYDVIEEVAVQDTCRTLFLLRRKQ